LLTNLQRCQKNGPLCFDESGYIDDMPYRFIHAADIHLDSPLRSLALRNPELADLIGNATRRAFVNIIDLCLTEQVDALLLAGDLYDGEQTSMKTAHFLAAQIRRLHEAGIKVFIIRGNHDALSRITREVTFPADSVNVFGSRPEAIPVEPAKGISVVIHGLSFARPQAPESLLPRFKPPVEGAVNIALMHTSLAGAPGHDLYAPCALGDLDTAGFDYWALGHIHKRTVSQGHCTIVMPGMPQGRDINEAGAKSVTLVTIADDRSVSIEERLTSIAQFESVPIDLNGIDDWRDMLGAVTETLQRVRANVASEHFVARVRLSGATSLAWRIRTDRELLLADAANQAIDIGKTWIEKIEINCRHPQAAAGPALDPVSELRRLIGEEVVPSLAYQKEIQDVAEELRGQLPAECRALLGSDEAGFRAALAALVTEGAEDVLARLHASNRTDPEAA
jgi:DNA repair protein SbcD/Mre11